MFTEHLSCTGTELGPGDTRRLTNRSSDALCGLSCLRVEKQSAVDIWGAKVPGRGGSPRQVTGSCHATSETSTCRCDVCCSPRPCGLGAPRGNCHSGYQAVVSGAALECSKVVVGMADMPGGLLEVTDC